MNNPTAIAATAKRFSAILDESSPQEASRSADEMLVFLYQLRDHYQILKSSRAQFGGRRFTFLENVI
ncbi:MAG: hypothetical protein HY966_07355, partial [Ignavibacteriales bacterium]|nr:hypothetical protein [Ignavibacteriales bacterium]